MMKKKIALGLLAFCLTLGGCASATVLTEEQEDLIAEYAVDTVLAHVETYDSRLVDLELYKEPPVIEETDNKMDEIADTPVINEEKPSAQKPEQGKIETIMLPEGVTLTYQYYETADSYPTDDSYDPMFTCDASENNTLLVLHFTMTNESGMAQRIDVPSKHFAMQVIMDGDNRSTIAPSMLLEDLMSYVGDLEAGESVPVVLITEIKKGTTFSTLSIVASGDGKDAYRTLP